jgi:glycosyltransferase involved in cell wall biosynthesis
MRTVFFLASDAGPSSAQFGLLAAALPRDRFRAEVGVVDPAAGPLVEVLRRADTPVHSLPLRHLLDLRGMKALRSAVRAAGAGVVHAWGAIAARAAGVLTGTTTRVIVSSSAETGGGVRGWLTARALRRADRVIPTTWAEGGRYRQLGVHAEALTRIQPAVIPAAAPLDPVGFRKVLGLPSAARLIVAGGRLDPAAGLKDAIMAFDVLRYDDPDLYLVLLGEGPERKNLDEFGRALAFDDFRIRFAGTPRDYAAVAEVAEVVWLTRSTGDLDLALAAMAAGRPVIGWQTPELAEVVDQAETGWLVPPGDRAQLAAKTHALLTEPAVARRVADAARRQGAERFPAARMVEQFARLYEELAG